MGRTWQSYGQLPVMPSCLHDIKRRVSCSGALVGNNSISNDETNGERV